MEHVDVGGMDLALRRRGTGPLLVLLHGGVCDGRVWRSQLASFAGEFTVVAWDAPGCGLSADAPGDFRMDDYAGCLAALVDAFHAGPAHVVGHSWGSTVALALWAQRPDLVRSLVLVGGYAGWAGSLPEDDVRERLDLALRSTAGDAPMPGLISDAMPEDRAIELSLIMSEVRPRSTRTMAVALAEADLRGVLPSITVPALVLRGADDVRSSADVADALHRAIPGSTLVTLPGLGHECFLEDAAAFDAALRGFLASV
jgi:pimeloyl-ACP methyl ester carboxylesterase